MLKSGVEIDFRFQPRITMENAGTQSIEYRNYMRQVNRAQKLWQEKYAREESPGTSFTSLLLTNFKQIVRVA